MGRDIRIVIYIASNKRCVHLPLISSASILMDCLVSTLIVLCEL